MQDLISEFKKHGELSIITDVVYIYDTLKEHNDMVTYNDNSKISLCNKYSLETHLNRLLSKKVWLKSGAYLIIEPTEALTVIDVNTGKADLKTNKESTFKKINLEAAKEIALQMKLRNISGIIIVDFINMSNNKDYDILTHEMSEYLTNDFSISNVVDITKLGLMELTRKKKEKSLEEIVNEKKMIIKIISWIIFIGLVIALIVGAINIYMVTTTSKRIISVDDAKDINADCIIVLGAGVKPTGKPSWMLEDRIIVGEQLYNVNAAPKLLMSGDHGRENYDEVNTMKNYAINDGIPSEDIFMDHAGFETYDSMYRAKKIFGAKKVVIVSQKYHLYRSLYIAKNGLRRIRSFVRP